MKSETGSREKCCAHVFLCFVSGMGRVQTTGFLIARFGLKCCYNRKKREQISFVCQFALLFVVMRFLRCVLFVPHLFYVAYAYSEQRHLPEHFRQQLVHKLFLALCQYLGAGIGCHEVA